MMREPGDDCPECGALLDGNQCRACGWRVVNVMSAVRPAYREPPPRLLARSSISDTCPEPGCGKRVGEHIAEAKRIIPQLGETKRLIRPSRPALTDDPDVWSQNQAEAIERLWRYVQTQSLAPSRAVPAAKSNEGKIEP